MSINIHLLPFVRPSPCPCVGHCGQRVICPGVNLSMTETECLTTEDPQAMLRWLTGGATGLTDPYSDRKLRLFACASARLPGAFSAGLLLPVHGRKPIDVAERLADDDYYLADQRDSESAITLAGVQGLLVLLERNGEYAAREWCGFAGRCADFLARQAALLRDIVGNPFGKPSLVVPPIEVTGGYHHRKRDGLLVSIGEAGKFRHVDTAWLTPDVLSLAQTAYDERGERGLLDPACLPILADALEEAGCPQVVEVPFGTGLLPHPLLDHLRSPGPHVRGCWAVDLILGKE